MMCSQPEQEGEMLQEQVVSRLGLDLRELRQEELGHVARLEHAEAEAASRQRWVKVGELQLHAGSSKLRCLMAIGQNLWRT